MLCDDSTNPDDVARLMNGETATLMATDPLYLVDYTDREYHGTRDKDWVTMRVSGAVPPSRPVLDCGACDWSDLRTR